MISLKISRVLDILSYKIMKVRGDGENANLCHLVCGGAAKVAVELSVVAFRSGEATLQLQHWLAPGTLGLQFKGGAAARDETT